MLSLKLKLILAALLLAALGGLLWHDHAQTHRANAEAAKRAAVEAQLANATHIIDTMKADAALNQETSHALVERLEAVERERAAHPLRLRCYVPAATVPAEGGGTGGTTDATAGRVDAGADLPTVDSGPGLSEFQRRCAVNAARQVTLQEWEAQRAH